uniref:KIAA1524 n=1 Tax=Nothobranchius furzeri TaxID=105023 RepID=A0A1A8V9F2_NOTFU
MDLTTCLKSLLLAIQQYRDSRTAQHAAQLQKQVEEVAGLRCDHLLSSGQVLPSECVSGLVELAGNPNTSPALTSSIISLLEHLASDDASWEILHSSYSLSCTLAAVIHGHSTTPGHPLVLQCLQVLQKLTYSERTFQSSSFITELIAFLMTSIQSQNDDIIMPCLGVMANLCRDNPSVQSHIKRLDNVKPFYRTLINFLAHNSLTVVVFTLSILSSLTLSEKVGEKLFDAKNIHQTFQLVFNIIGKQGNRNIFVSFILFQMFDVSSKNAWWFYLNMVLNETLAAESVSEATLSFVEMLLPVLLELLNGLDPAKGDAHLRKHGLRVTHITGLLLVLCGEESTRSLVSSQVSAQVCLSQVEALLSCCHSNSPISCLPPGSDNDLSHVCTEALLKTLELMSKLRQQVENMETSFYRMLQDQRMVTPLALTLTSHHRGRVQTGLALLLEATPLPDFPSLVLGESIAANNAYRQREAQLSIKRVAVPDFPPPRTGSNILDSSSGCRSVSSLVEKIQTGLELQDPAKDSRVSELIDVYEQKLAAFVSKESRLQDLLEAKALALAQADRLIAQYRLQRAQAEAEARKLASLLKDAERRREDLQGELSSQVLEVERSRADMEELLQHNARLQRDSEEHQALKGAYNALLNRFNETDSLLKELQTAHVSLCKQNEALRKNQEVLQQQQDRLASVLEEREQEVRSLQSDVQKKNDDITGLLAQLRAKDEKLEEKDQEKKDLEETVDVLRKELNKTEQARKDASIKASSLELQKSQLETKLKQKEEELNKHSAMIAMIHSLSSGKVKSDVNLSL